MPGEVNNKVLDYLKHEDKTVLYVLNPSSLDDIASFPDDYAPKILLKSNEKINVSTDNVNYSSLFPFFTYLRESSVSGEKLELIDIVKEWNSSAPKKEYGPQEKSVLDHMIINPIILSTHLVDYAGQIISENSYVLAKNEPEEEFISAHLALNNKSSSIDIIAIYGKIINSEPHTLRVPQVLFSQSYKSIEKPLDQD